MFQIDAFLHALEHQRRYAQHTLTAYQSDMHQFVNYLTERQCLTSALEIRHFHIRSWVASMMDGGITPRSINRKLSCLKTYFQYLRKNGAIELDPMKKVLAPKTGKKLPVFVPENQMEILFSQVEFPSGYEGVRDKTILEIFYNTGIRKQELIQLKVLDIDFSRQYFTVKGKGGKERIAPMSSILMQQIETFLAIRNHEFPGMALPWLFLTSSGAQLYPKAVYNIVNRYLSMVTTIEQRSPHVLRHTFATHLTEQGADLNAIKELLGHANLAATQVYTHNSIERLKKVYEQAHPKSKLD